VHVAAAELAGECGAEQQATFLESAAHVVEESSRPAALSSVVLCAPVFRHRLTVCPRVVDLSEEQEFGFSRRPTVFGMETSKQVEPPRHGTDIAGRLRVRRSLAVNLSLLAVYGALNYAVWLSQKPILELAQRSARADAVVTARQPRYHDRIEYRFVVLGTAYYGRGTGAHKVRIGDNVTVYYLPSNPSINLAQDPEQAAGQAIGSFAFSLFLSGVFAWGALRYCRRF